MQGGPGEWFSVGRSNPAASPAGGVSSTPADLHKFIEALLNGKLISIKTFEYMTSSHVNLGSGSYGMGFESTEVPRSFGHGGRGPGHHFELRIYPNSWHVIYPYDKS